jgi:two-component system secretion response regulator SsrB
MKIKIAVADDHPLVITGVFHIISNCPDMEIVGSYSNGAELLKGLKNSCPDVLLLDIQMPGQTGDELTEAITALYPAIKVLALTNHDNVYYIKNMLRKGAHGYILKTAREEVLINAIRTLNSGEQYLETSLKEKVLQDTLNAKKQLSSNPLLSPREKEVLQNMAADLTSQQIADKIFVSKRTIDSYRISLMTKLGVKSGAALVKKGIQLGLID